MIAVSERNDWAERLGVATGQVERDHLISHVLYVISRHPEAALHFYGGTALCRTYLDGTRLSEDVDLLHATPIQGLELLTAVLPKALRRDYPGLGFEPGPHEADGRSVILEVADVRLPVKLYVGRLGPDTRAYEFEDTPVALRYSDLPADVLLRCPTLPSFAAMKIAAWCDRHTPRDLFDLSGLAHIGALDEHAEQILRATCGYGFVMTELTRLPGATRTAWEAELAAQTGSLPTPEACVTEIKQALSDLRHREKDV